MTLSSDSSSGRVAALDLGEARTGVAISDPGGMLARPLQVVPSERLIGYLETLLGNEGITVILVGVPRRLGGGVGFQAHRVLDKLNALRDRFPEVRFVEWDERFTTRVARSSPSVSRSGSYKGGRAGRRKGKETGRRV
ncbi:MAG TPA: RuvX/YqgF family protein, partial [Rubrobacteraceae bacterium]|nr:RuvX/YqgF family protein [Rubrobacteraceae bacterium]